MAKRGRKPKSETIIVATEEKEPLRTIATVGEKKKQERDTVEEQKVYRPESMRNVEEMPVISRPVVEKPPPYQPPSEPVICSGCKSTVEKSMTVLCKNCKGSLRYCPMCAKPNSCHKCGQILVPKDR
jgi:hypothetical protein